ncbi:MAG: peroxidase family protein [Anaerolineales bacterium]
MKRIHKTFLVGLTIIMTACQSIVPSQLNLSASNADYIKNSEQSSMTEPLDGKGNNVANPSWGSTNTQLIRVAPSAYADGISSPSGADRPSARMISDTFSVSPADGIPNDRDFTAFVYAWGQFLDHDIDLTVSASPKETLPVIVPVGDEWFDPSKTGSMTIPMSRSNYDITTGTSTSNPRQQINSITAFIDGSQIYGVDAQRAAALREFSGGRLKTSDGNLLPLNTDGFENANDAHRVEDNQLFLAGDVRANENPELLSLHTLFVREHNRLASEVAQQHPQWTDEELYQYARRIVIAELQKITFDEFLPSLLGTQAIPSYQGYQADVNPSIANEFSTAAFRFGHSMLGNDIEFLDNDGNEVRDAMELRDSFFNPVVLHETDIDPILKYLASDNAQEIDTKVVDDVRNFLFGQPGQGGFDLASLNIQRGRDHGLADYNTVRAAYGLAPVTSFAQITSDTTLQASLASTYGSVNNIDLWIGGLAEDHLPNSSMGPTFTAILVNQFTRLRDGDRFWYQNSLSDDLVRDIQNTTMTDIIRRNTKLTKLQADVFVFNESITVMIDATPVPTATPQSQNNGQGNTRRDGHQPPQAAIDACANVVENTSCSFIGRNQNTVNGTCQVIPASQLACVPTGGPRRP